MTLWVYYFFYNIDYNGNTNISKAFTLKKILISFRELTWIELWWVKWTPNQYCQSVTYVSHLPIAEDGNSLSLSLSHPPNYQDHGPKISNVQLSLKFCNFTCCPSSVSVQEFSNQLKTATNCLQHASPRCSSRTCILACSNMTCISLTLGGPKEPGKWDPHLITTPAFLYPHPQLHPNFSRK